MDDRMSDGEFEENFSPMQLAQPSMKAALWVEAKRAREAEKMLRKDRDILLSSMNGQGKLIQELEKEISDFKKLVATLEVAKDYYKNTCKEPRD